MSYSHDRGDARTPQSVEETVAARPDVCVRCGAPAKLWYYGEAFCDDMGCDKRVAVRHAVGDERKRIAQRVRERARAQLDPANVGEELRIRARVSSALSDLADELERESS